MSFCTTLHHSIRWPTEATRSRMRIVSNILALPHNIGDFVSQRDRDCEYESGRIVDGLASYRTRWLLFGRFFIAHATYVGLYSTNSRSVRLLSQTWEVIYTSLASCSCWLRELGWISYLPSITCGELDVSWTAHYFVRLNVVTRENIWNALVKYDQDNLKNYFCAQPDRKRARITVRALGSKDCISHFIDNAEEGSEQSGQEESGNDSAGASLGGNESDGSVSWKNGPKKTRVWGTRSKTDVKKFTHDCYRQVRENKWEKYLRNLLANYWPKALTERGNLDMKKSSAPKKDKKWELVRHVCG